MLLNVKNRFCDSFGCCTLLLSLPVSSSPLAAHKRVIIPCSKPQICDRIFGQEWPHFFSWLRFLESSPPSVTSRVRQRDLDQSKHSCLWRHLLAERRSCSRPPFCLGDGFSCGICFLNCRKSRINCWTFLSGEAKIWEALSLSAIAEGKWSRGEVR